MEIFDVLEDFQYEMNLSDLDQKWQMYGAPLGTLELSSEQTTFLEKQKEIFIKEMESGQEEFEETLDSIEITVQGFCQYDELEKYKESYIDTYEDVCSVN